MMRMTTASRRPQLKDVITLKFEMYAHYLARDVIDDVDGWLRNMLHSFGQQVMYQDPVWYRLNALMDPSQRTWFIVVPCRTQAVKARGRFYLNK